MRRDGGCETEEANVCRAGATLPRICDVKPHHDAAYIGNRKPAIADALSADAMSAPASCCTCLQSMARAYA